MKKYFLLIFMFWWTANLAFAQCNYKPVPKKFVKFAVSDERPKEEISTKVKLLFEKYDVAGRFSFVRSEGQNYFFLLIGRQSSKRWIYTPEDPLTLHLESGDAVKIFPHTTYEGKKVLLNFLIGGFYKISIEQIELLTQSPIVQLEVVVDGSIDGGLNFDAAGWKKIKGSKSSYSPPITAPNRKENLINSAQCFLQKIK